MTTIRTAPTKAMAELLGLPYEAPAETGWSTTEAVIRNGGLRPPGTEGLSASKGRGKTGQNKIEKDTSFTTDVPNLEKARTGAQKPVSRGRIISEGTYTWEGTKVRVRLSQTSGKPYGLVWEDGAWKYTPGIVAKLDSANRVEDIASAASAVRVGFYLHNGTVAEVVRSGAGRLYAKLLNQDTWKFDYVAGLVTKLDPKDRLTLAQAEELGKTWHHCGCCGRELTNPESIDRGIGPICASKL